MEDVLAAFQFEKSRPYLLYRNKNDEVGCWSLLAAVHLLAAFGSHACQQIG